MSLRNLYLIGHCLSLDEHPRFRETIIAQFADPEFDWDDFIWTCSNHLVFPVIYLKFKEYDLLDEIPEELKSHLEEIYRLNRIRNEQILIQMKQITATLNKADISPIYLKGTGNLIDGIYSDIGERIIGDIDFLVPEKDFLTAAELFQKEEYTICKPTVEPIDQFKLKHYPRLWKEDEVADIEIHRLLVNIKYSKHFSADFVRKSKKAPINHTGCYVLADEHKVILNFIHSQLTNAGHLLGVATLRDVYDIYCYAKRTDLNKIPQATRYMQKCIAYLKISEKLLNLNGSFYPEETIRSRMYRYKHDMNFTSEFIYNFNRMIWILAIGIGHGISHIRETITHPKLFRKNIGILFNPSWYMQTIKIGWAKYNGKKY